MDLNRSPLLLLALGGFLTMTSIAAAQSLAPATQPDQPVSPPPTPAPAPTVAPTLAPGLPPASAEKLPTGKEVLAKFLSVTGTEAARKAIKNRVLTGTFKNESAGIEGKSVIKMSGDGRLHLVVDLGERGKVVRWTDGKSGAEAVPKTEPKVLTGDDLLDAKRVASLCPELTPDEFFKSIENTGVEKVLDQDCYKVVTLSPSSAKRSWYYSKETGLLVKWTMTKQRGAATIITDTFLSDWKEFDGVKLPTLLKQINTFGAAIVETSMHTDKVEHNAKLTDADFAVPEELKQVLAEAAKPKEEVKPKPEGK